MELRLQEYVNKPVREEILPYYIYEIHVKKVCVGIIVLREGTMEQRYYDGHIGYTIYPMHRGHHYAYEATLLVLEIAQNKGFKDIIITCSPDNMASKKTIQRLPTTYLETKRIPRKQRKFFQAGEKVKEIYHIFL